MRQRLARYASALIVSVVSSYCGLARYAAADAAQSPACSLRDAQAWQLSLDEPNEEASPAYILRVTEAFIERCPDRPEAASAHRIAGLSAGWAGQADLAYTHFAKAGHMRDTEALFIAMASAFHAGDEQAAAAFSADAFDAWVSRIARRGTGIATVETLPGGDIISVSFAPMQADAPTSRVWIARPANGAWPAALSVKSDAQLTAFHRLVSGKEAASLTHVRLYRCRQRTLIGRSDSPIDQGALETLARESMLAYLASPDRSAKGQFDICLFADDILPESGIPGRVATQ